MMQTYRRLATSHTLNPLKELQYTSFQKRFPQGHEQRRGIKLFEVPVSSLASIFSKEAREKRKKRLREDLQRGAFDDFKELKETGGKLWHASFGLLPKTTAQIFPSIQVTPATGDKFKFPVPKGDAPDVTLVCAGFKAGSEAMLASWRQPFIHKFGKAPAMVGSLSLIDLSLVESRVMSIWPFRTLVMRAAKLAATSSDTPPLTSEPEQHLAHNIPDCIASGVGHAAAPNNSSADMWQAEPHDASTATEGALGRSTPPNISSADRNTLPKQSTGSNRKVAGGFAHRDLFFFGDPYDLCQALGITNRLTGYVFVLDRHARVRFRGCGNATPTEAAAMLAATAQLLPKQNAL